MRRKAFIVVGLGYGDEGKGLATDYLCTRSMNAIVIRYNGGQQAGHTVVTKSGQRHVFSNFGSGTLRGVPTYWSNYCTFSPAFFLEEYDILPSVPQMFIHPACPMTTHYDVLYNRAIEATRGNSRHGSCGLGFGATTKRQKVASLDLCVADLLKPAVYRRKLKDIRRYYKEKVNNETRFDFSQFDHNAEDQQFDQYAGRIDGLISSGIIKFVTEEGIFSPLHKWETYIFEGAQGILLDPDFGTSPYVTKSNTTSKNALKIIHRNFTNSEIDLEIFYITRAYLTRHGSGPFEQGNYPIRLHNVEFETNKYNDWQGEFRIGPLNVDLLNYSLRCDAQYSEGIKKNLIVTCLDQLPDSAVPIYTNGLELKIPYQELYKFLKCKFAKVKFSFSNCSEDLE